MYDSHGGFFTPPSIYLTIWRCVCVSARACTCVCCWYCFSHFQTTAKLTERLEITNSKLIIGFALPLSLLYTIISRSPFSIIVATFSLQPLRRIGSFACASSRVVSSECFLFLVARGCKCCRQLFLLLRATLISSQTLLEAHSNGEIVAE